MSHDIFETADLQVTAFVGVKGCVQISCKGEYTYATLSDIECMELAHALLSRVLSKPGYRATD